jgi:hypothetical protein
MMKSTIRLCIDSSLSSDAQRQPLDWRLAAGDLDGSAWWGGAEVGAVADAVGGEDVDDDRTPAGGRAADVSVGQHLGADAVEGEAGFVEPADDGVDRGRIGADVGDDVAVLAGLRR